MRHRKQSCVVSTPPPAAAVRCGFLGPLHLEVWLARLSQEHHAAVISTPPTVTYELLLAGGERKVLEGCAEYPRDKKVGPGGGHKRRKRAEAGEGEGRGGMQRAEGQNHLRRWNSTGGFGRLWVD